MIIFINSRHFSPELWDLLFGFDSRPNYKKVFETVRFASRNSSSSRGSSPVQPTFQRGMTLQPSTVTSSSTGPRMSAFASYPSQNVDPNRMGMGSCTVYSSLSTHSLDSAGQSETESIASDEVAFT